MVVLSGCSGNESEAVGPPVTVCSTLDAAVVQATFTEFTSLTHHPVEPTYDVAATGPNDSPSALQAKAGCDVFWTDQVLQLVKLDRQGRLESYSPSEAANFPPMYRSPNRTWHCMSARANPAGQHQAA